MDLLIYSISTIIIATIFSNLLSAILNYKTKKLPGPTKLPVIGNLHNMIGPLPHQTLRRLSKKHGPLMHLQLGESSTIIVSSAKLARECMTSKNDLSFADRPKLVVIEVCTGVICDNISFSPYGKYWRQMRKLCVVELLSNKRVQSFTSVREEEVQSLVGSIRSSSLKPVNLTEGLLGLMSSVVSRAAFGRKYDCESAAALASKFKESVRLGAGFGIADLYPSVEILRKLSPSLRRAKKLHAEIDGALQRMIDKHDSEIFCQSAGIEEDLVDVLLRLRKSADLEIPITMKHIKAILSDMYAGGIDTTATTTEWAMAEMMKNPRVMVKAQAEIRQALKGKKIIKETDIQGLTYLKTIVQEILRLHPPVPLLLPRECREPCVIQGYEIPVGTKLLINAWAIGRDPEYWDDAETFYPERFLKSSVDYKETKNFEYIPFGAGRRMCPGTIFGSAIIELALAQLLYHFDWNLPDQMRSEDLDMTELFGVTAGRKFDLRLVAVPFVPVEE